MGSINKLINWIDKFSRELLPCKVNVSAYVHPVNKEKKYNPINSKDKTYQHYSSRTEVQNQMHVSENQSSQVPYIIFFQLMKLSFSYKARFFHRLPPAYSSILRQLSFSLTEISCMMKKCSKVLCL